MGCTFASEKQKIMEKENTLSETIAIAVGCVILGAVYSFVEHSLFSIILFGFAAAAIIVVYILRQTVWRSVETLEKDICKQLDKSGFRYEKKEGDLYVIKDNCHFQIQLADSFNRGIKHLYVMYKFRDDNSNKVTIDGWSRASNVINTRNTNTIFVTLEDHFCCCYQTAIGNSKDFMKEFGQAYDAIGEAMDDYRSLYPYLERDYPNSTGSQTSIGFRQND